MKNEMLYDENRLEKPAKIPQPINISYMMTPRLHQSQDLV